MNKKMQLFGKQLKEEMDCILCYRVTAVGDAKKDICMVIDMRNDYADQSGVCLLKENLNNLSDA